MGPIGCPETSVNNYLYSPRNNPEQRSSRTRKFITAFTRPRRTSSWARSIQSICPHPTFWWSILILSFHLSPCLPSALFPSGLKEKLRMLTIIVIFYQIWRWSNQFRFVWHAVLRRQMLIKVFVGEDVGKRPLRTRHRWEVNVKTDLKRNKIGWCRLE